MKSVNTPSTGWKIKTRSLSNGNNQPSPLMESDQAFDRRLDHWAQSSTFRNMSSHIINDVQKDMDRRQPKQQHAPLEKRKSLLSDIQSFMFDTPSSLNDKDHALWLYHGRDVHHPHQWLKLASLFHIHPKTAHQRSLLFPATLQAAQIDRHLPTDINRKPLESYLDLRRTQNRTYAEHAVAEGIKLYETQKVTEALEYYKRALDMDPQYAEGWYRVAQSLLQQKRSDEALGTLKRALRIDPTHEDAKALLCTLENTTTSYTSDTKESKRRRSPSPSSRKAKRRRSPSPTERKRHVSPTERKRHHSPTSSPTDRKRHTSPKRHSHRSTSTDRKRHHRSPSKRHHRSRHHSGDRHRRHHRHRSTSKDRSHRKKSSSDRRHHRSKHSPSRKHD